MDKNEWYSVFDKYCKKLRIVPAWDVKLEFVEDPLWRKTGDFKVDCDDKKAVLLLNARNPRQENLEEVIVHELMHLKMYPRERVCQDDFCKFSKFKYLSAEKSPNISCLHIS